MSLKVIIFLALITGSLTNDSELITRNEEIPNKSLGGFVVFNMKKPIDPFIGRERELERIRTVRAVAITGPPGIGKTELARKYASDFTDSNSIWIDATSYETLTHSFNDLAQFVNVSVSEKTSSEIIRDVFRHFRDERSVFIFDNAPNDNYVVNNIDKFLPEPTDVRIVITSRNDLRKYDIVNLPPFSVPESIEFVKRNVDVSNESTDDLVKFVQVLRNVPLALSRSVKFMKDKNESGTYTIADFLEDYEQAERSKFNEALEEALLLETANQRRELDGDVLAGLRPVKEVHVVSLEPPTGGQIRDVVLGKIGREAERIAMQTEMETRRGTKKVRNFFRKLRKDLL